LVDFRPNTSDSAKEITDALKRNKKLNIHELGYNQTSDNASKEIADALNQIG
jgi:hypothetical protein